MAEGVPDLPAECRGFVVHLTLEIFIAGGDARSSYCAGNNLLMLVRIESAFEMFCSQSALRD